jgi:predicted RNA-binding protein with RPS1 domain
VEDGFIHIGQMSWQHIKRPKEVLGEGQAVQVKVISISEDKKKIGLSVKQLSTSPWENAASKYGVGEKVIGTVTRLTDFGAFVQLEPGVEGMVHISGLDHKRVARVADVVAVGQELELQVRDVDPITRRIGLSLKAFRQAQKLRHRRKKPRPNPSPRRRSGRRRSRGAAREKNRAAAEGSAIHPISSDERRGVHGTTTLDRIRPLVRFDDLRVCSVVRQVSRHSAPHGQRVHRAGRDQRPARAGCDANRSRRSRRHSSSRT